VGWGEGITITTGDTVGRGEGITILLLLLGACDGNGNKVGLGVGNDVGENVGVEEGLKLGLDVGTFVRIVVGA